MSRTAAGFLIAWGKWLDPVLRMGLLVVRKDLEAGPLGRSSVSCGEHSLLCSRTFCDHRVDIISFLCSFLKPKLSEWMEIGVRGRLVCVWGLYRNNKGKEGRSQTMRVRRVTEGWGKAGCAC